MKAYRLPAKSILEADATQYREELRSRREDKPLARKLFSELLLPIPEYGRKAALVIIPDGSLHLLPFSALTDGSGYVLASHTVDVSPSSTVYSLLSSRVENERAVTMPYIGVAAWTQPTDNRNPIVRAVTGPQRSQLVPLPDSKLEVESIAQDLPKPSTILEGASATEGRFKSLPLNSTDVIHLALHGYADLDYPERSALIFAPDANGSEDGLLQLREIRDLHLRAKLVTLSACDTGVGPVGEAGVDNLVNAFIEAGADSVVSTLWELDDDDVTRDPRGSGAGPAMPSRDSRPHQRLPANCGKPVSPPARCRGFSLVAASSRRRPTLPAGISTCSTNPASRAPGRCATSSSVWGPLDRVLVIGDTRQHQGVDAGKPFEQMQDAGLRTAQLSKIMRQKEPGLLAAVEHLANNETRQGIAMLAAQGRVHEVQDREERVAAIATAYAQRPEGTIIVSPDNASRRAINQAVRAELQDRGTLSSADTKLPTLIPRSDLTGADRRWAAQYQVGDVVYFPRGSTSAAIPARSYATVTVVARDSNTLTVALPSGETRSYDPRRLHGVSVYQEIERPFASGDRIQFTAPSHALGVANRDMATITRIEGTQVTARVDGGEVPQHVRFDARDMRHFDHGYAVTSHSSQSATADRVLVNMDTRAHPDLISTRFAYVAVSRASQDAQIFTNDAAALGQRLSRDVSKSSAVDFKHGQEASTDSYSKKSPAIDSSYALGL